MNFYIVSVYDALLCFSGHLMVSGPSPFLAVPLSRLARSSAAFFLRKCVYFFYQNPEMCQFGFQQLRVYISSQSLSAERGTLAIVVNEAFEVKGTRCFIIANFHKKNSWVDWLMLEGPMAVVKPEVWLMICKCQIKMIGL